MQAATPSHTARLSLWNQLPGRADEQCILIAEEALQKCWAATESSAVLRKLGSCPHLQHAWVTPGGQLAITWSPGATCPHS